MNQKGRGEVITNGRTSYREKIRKAIVKKRYVERKKRDPEQPTGGGGGRTGKTGDRGDLIMTERRLRRPQLRKS